MWEKPSFEQLKESLTDPTNPIGMRMRAAYYLRQEYDEIERNYNVDDGDDINEKIQRQQDVIKVLANGLYNQQHGALMRHEFAYVMGQLRDDRSCDALERILQDDNDNIMVRHEASEALGAIGSDRSITVLQTVLQQTQERNIPELYETCRIALDVIEWRNAGSNINEQPAACACMLSPYSSVDPAPPHPSHADLPFEELGAILRDDTVPIFERYRAMFSLRNRGGDAAVRELCTTLTTDTSSALLRHEIAYVLGQMQHPASVEALEESLRRPAEHCMVRHESAEALGAIDGRWEDVERILQEFTNDSDDVVRESCLVALDAADYWGYSNNDKEPEEDDNDEDGNTEQVESTGKSDPTKDESDTSLSRPSFAHQKADQRILVNHFNIKQ